MKRALTALSGVLLAITAQAQWQKVATLPTPRHLNAVAFANNNKGTIAGEGAAFYQTEDGGSTWRHIQMPEHTTSLNGVFWLDSQRGWMVGSNGSAEGRRTTDGGQTWVHMPMPAGSYYAVRFIDQNVGTSVGNGGAAISRNGGQSWLMTPYNAIMFRDANNALAWNDSGVYKTTNSGQSWTQTLGVSGMIPHWVSNNVAIATGDGGVYRSTDAGQTWQKVFNVTGYKSGQVLSENNIIIWHWNGDSISSRDGGQTWVEVTGQCPKGIIWGDKVDSNTLCAVSGEGYIYRTADAGLTWNLVYNGLGSLPRTWHIDFVDELHGWAVGEGGTILKTSNGGISWKQQMNGFGFEIDSIKAISNDVILAAGGVGHVLRSVDGGVTWETQRIKVTGQIFSRDETVEAMDVDPASGFAVAAGFGGTIFRSLDGGISWDSVGYPTITDTVYFYAVKVLDANTAYAVGQHWIFPQDQTIWRTTDRGQTWQPIAKENGRMIAVDATDANHIWTLELGGYVIKTTNGGQSWTTVELPFAWSYADLDMANAQVGYASGWYGFIAKTTDGGATWTTLNTGTDQMHFLTIHAIDANNVLAVGRDEDYKVRFWKSTNGGATWTSEQVENWPNSLIGIAVTPNGTTLLSGYDGTIHRKEGASTSLLPPAGYTVTGGTVNSGGLPELATSNDTYLDVRVVGVQHTTLEVSATAPAGNVTSLKFRVESALNPQLPAMQLIELFDYTTGQWVQLDNRGPSTVDSVAEVNLTTSAAKYVDPATRQMKARVTWALLTKPNSDRTNRRTITIDQVQWSVTR